MKNRSTMSFCSLYRSLMAFMLFIPLLFCLGCSNLLGDGGADDSYDGYDSYDTTDTAYEGEGSADGGDDGQSDGEDAVDPQPGQLTAAEWNDLEEWEFWTELLGQEGFSSMETAWGLSTQGRIPVTVTSDGSPLVDLEVQLLDGAGEVIWRSHTDNAGQAELFAGVTPTDQDTSGEVKYTLRVVDADGEELVSQSEVSSGVDERIELIVPTTSSVPAPDATADIMFVVDTTGSMSDELEYIKSELADVINQVDLDNQQRVDLRLSVNFYRDEGDVYVVRPFPFTTDVSKAVNDLSAQSAGGGGDFPEAVHSALENAVYDHAWSESAVARILFLVLDAPPHDETAVLESIRQTVEGAAAKGIAVIPVTASGIDQETEFLMRILSILTNGTYVFITDDSGIGGDHLEPTVGYYQIEYLNELIVRLINERLSGG